MAALLIHVGNLIIGFLLLQPTMANTVMADSATQNATQNAKQALPSNVEALGDATGFVDRIYEMLDSIELFEDFERAEIRLLAHFMQAYRVPAGSEIIHEGDAGDYMLLIIDGEIDIFKNDHDGLRKRIAVVGPGKTLDSGERQAPEVSEGQTILYAKYAGTEVKIEGTEYLILSEKDILAIV